MLLHSVVRPVIHFVPEEYHPRWGARTSNPVKSVYSRLGGFDSCLFRHTFVQKHYKPEDISLASHVRKMVTVFLIENFENGAARTTTPENAMFLIKQ